MPELEEILKVFTPVGLAIAWLWSQWQLKDKEEHKQKLDLADREREYSERLQVRLERAQKELENAMAALEAKENPESVLRDIASSDPGFMFVKKRIAPKVFVYLKVSRGYAITYLGGPSEIIEGKTETLLGWTFADTDEAIYASQEGRTIREEVESPFTGLKGTFVGRKFPLNFAGQDYIVGVGDHEFN